MALLLTGQTNNVTVVAYCKTRHTRMIDSLVLLRCCSQAAHEVCDQHPEDHQGHEDGCCLQDEGRTSIY